MKSKLTLRMSEEAIERAKSYAAERGLSVSKLVENFFRALEPEGPIDTEFSPLVGALWGALEGEELDEDDYRTHLSDKHS